MVIWSRGQPETLQMTTHLIVASAKLRQEFGIDLQVQARVLQLLRVIQERIMTPNSQYIPSQTIITTTIATHVICNVWEEMMTMEEELHVIRDQATA